MGFLGTYNLSKSVVDPIGGMVIGCTMKSMSATTVKALLVLERGYEQRTVRKIVVTHGKYVVLAYGKNF